MSTTLISGTGNTETECGIAAMAVTKTPTGSACKTFAEVIDASIRSAKEAHHNGDPEACYLIEHYLELRYLHGKAVAGDTEAMHEFALNATLANESAAFSREARKMMTFAARRNHIDSVLSLLFVSLESGNMAHARRWARKAAFLGNAEAALLVAELEDSPEGEGKSLVAVPNDHAAYCQMFPKLAS